MAAAPARIDEVPQQESKDNGDLAATFLKDEQGDAKGLAEDRHIEGQQAHGKDLLKARPVSGEDKAEVASSDNQNEPGNKQAARTEAKHDAGVYELTVNESSSDEDDLDEGEDSSDYSDEETDSDDSEEDEDSQEEDEDKEEAKA